MARLSLLTRAGYGVGHVLNDLCSSLWFTYLLIFLHKVERFPNTLAGVVLLIGQIADAISTPFVGHEADRTDDTLFCIKYGRRKTWHLAGTACVLAAFPFIFMGCLGCSFSNFGYQVLYLAPFVVIFQFGWASVQISHLALIPSLTSDPHERTELNAIRYAFTVFSNIAVYLVTWLVLGINSHKGQDNSVIGPDDASTFRIIVGAIVSLGCLFSLIFHVTVKEKANRIPGYEPVPIVNNSASERNSEVSSTTNSHHYTTERNHMRPGDWFKMKQFYLVGLIYMCTRLFCNLSQAYMPIYLQDTLKLSPESVAYIPLTMYVSGFITTLAMKPLNKKFGRKVAFILGCLLGIAGCIWISLGDGDFYKAYLVYPVAALLGAGGSTMLVTSLSITADLIGNSVESGAFVYGAMSFTDKLANGLAIMVIQYYSPYSAICTHCLLYYRYVLAGVCGGACVVAAAAVCLLVTGIARTRPTDGVATISAAHSDTAPLLQDAAINQSGYGSTDYRSASLSSTA